MPCTVLSKIDASVHVIPTGGFCFEEQDSIAWFDLECEVKTDVLEFWRNASCLFLLFLKWKLSIFAFAFSKTHLNTEDTVSSRLPYAALVVFCSGLSSGLPKGTPTSLSPQTVNTILRGKRGFADAREDFMMWSSWIICLDPSPMAGVFLRVRREDSHRETVWGQRQRLAWCNHTPGTLGATRSQEKRGRILL